MTARSGKGAGGTARKSNFLSDVEDEDLDSGGSNIGSSFQNAVENVQQDLDPVPPQGTS